MSRDEPRSETNRTVECTLSPAGAERRRRWWRAELLDAYEGIEPLEDGFRATFSTDDGVVESLAAWVEMERGCCSFADFSIELGPPYEVVAVSMTGPEGTADLVREGLEEFDEIDYSR